MFGDNAILPDDDPTDSEDRPLSCPSCHSENLIDRGDVFEEEHCIGTQFICLDCRHAWVDEFGRDWENYQ